MLVNRELALKRTKTSVGFLEGKTIPLGFYCNKSCSQFSAWEWPRKKMTSPILVMNFYSLLNFKYVNLIPRWPPKICIVKPSILMYAPGLNPTPLVLYLLPKHRAHQGEDGLAQSSPGLPFQCLQEFGLFVTMSLHWVEVFPTLQQFQRLARNSQWNAIKTTSLLISGLEITSIRNTLSYNIVSTSQLGSKLFMN